MTKAIMMSIQPKWVEKILNGEKTAILIKRKPNQIGRTFLTPTGEWKHIIKVYIYCTKGDKKDIIVPMKNGRFTGVILNGKVVAEFTCRKFGELRWLLFANANPRSKQTICNALGMSFAEITEYMGDREKMSVMHISNLKIYDKPKELGEFHKIGVDGNAIDVGMKRPMQSWGYVQEI